MNKRYTIKVYNMAGSTFKGTLSVVGNYSFSESINAGLGSLEITVPTQFDEGFEASVTKMDKIELWVQDIDTTGLLIYSGYIYRTKRILKADNQQATIYALGYGTRLGFSPDMDSTTSVQVLRSGTITDVVKAIIDNFKTTIGDTITNYSATSVETSATTVSYKAQSNTVLDTIEKIRQMSGSTWFWKVDANNVFWFKQFSATPVHTFTMGKELSELTIEENTDDIINFAFLWNGLQESDVNFLAKAYYNSASITSYWKRFYKSTDGRITSSTYLDLLGTALINANKAPNKLITFTVKDNNRSSMGYDIESIHAGDTIRILNNDDSELYSGNLIITNVDYTPEAVTVKVADYRTITSRELNDIRQSLDKSVYEDGIKNITLSSV